MSQFKVVAVALCVLLTASFAVAQQQGVYGPQGTQEQRSQQQGEYGSQGTQGQRSQQPGTGGTAGASQDIQQLSQAAERENVDLSKAIDKARQEVQDGQIIGVAVVRPQAGGEQAECHVYVLKDNQVHDFVLDAKGEKVQDKQVRPMLSSPWRAGRLSQAGSGTLSASQAQRIGSLVEQHDADLRQAINKARQELRGARVVGAFLVSQEQVSPQVRQQPDAQQTEVFAKIFAVDQNDQLKVITLDAKETKVIHTETSQSLSSPWQSSASPLGTGQQSGMGGSQQPRSQQPGESSSSPRSQQPAQPSPSPSGGSGY